MTFWAQHFPLQHRVRSSPKPGKCSTADQHPSHFHEAHSTEWTKFSYYLRLFKKFPLSPSNMDSGTCNHFPDCFFFPLFFFCWSFLYSRATFPHSSSSAPRKIRSTRQHMRRPTLDMALALLYTTLIIQTPIGPRQSKENSCSYLQASCSLSNFTVCTAA